MSAELFHSVRLDPEKCVGCTTCIKHCPTEAIRVRDGRARIIEERCIDCGECIRVCPHGAKRAVSDPFSIIDGFSRKVAVPAPTLVSQFERSSVDRILSGLLKLGFDEVFEVAEAAELVAAECVTLAETKDHLHWELLGRCAKQLNGKAAKRLVGAAEEIEEQEDQHLYHSRGFARELWIKHLGMRAVLPPPEEERNVTTAIGAARAMKEADKERGH